MTDPFLSRLQFAFTAMFHILWPVLTIGLSIFLVLMEALHLKTKNKIYYHQARFWSRLFILNFAVGVVTGIPMEFQFGTNWSRFSQAGGDIFGHILGFEAAMAFMLEAAFLSIMIWGWKKVPPGTAPVFHPDGRLGGLPVGLLDHGGQFLDAYPGRRRLLKKGVLS